MEHVSRRAADRADIDGLRAIAVLLVIGFHFFPGVVPGGFIGIDVLFVVSGFLITRLIVTALENGSFVLADFYLRRLKRMIPALAVVLLVSLVAGWWLLFPADYRDLGKHAAAAAVFVVNFVFLQEPGPFDAASELKPLLHLWPVSVLGQFLIAWPLMMVLAWRWRFPPFLIAVALLLVSLALNLWLTATHETAAFYLPVTRFWEFMVGAILAIVSLVAAGRDDIPPKVREALPWVGLALLAAGLVLIDRQSSFPGLWAVLPALGAAMILFGGPHGLLGGRVLSFGPLVYVGLISYPLYLWHWPILAFARHAQFEEPGPLAKAVCIAVAFALAHLTHRYMETPVRLGALQPRMLKNLPAVLGAALAVVGCAGLAIYMADGFPRRYAGDAQVLFKDYQRDADALLGAGLCARSGAGEFALTTECGPDAFRKTVVVWGDSHAGQLLRGLIELERGRNDIRVVSFSRDGCPPILSFASEQVDCAAVNEVAIQRMWELRPDTVIMAARWDDYDASGRLDDESIEWTIARLKSMNVRHIVGIGQFPLWDAPVPGILARYYRTMRLSFAQPSPDEPLRTKDRLAQSAGAASYKVGRSFLISGSSFVNPASTLCNAEGCMLTVPGTRFEPIAWDQTHLTYAGSIFFVSRTAGALLGN